MGKLLQLLGKAMHQSQEREVQKLEEVHTQIKHLEKEIDPLKELLLDMETVFKSKKN